MTEELNDTKDLKFYSKIGIGIAKLDALYTKINKVLEKIN